MTDDIAIHIEILGLVLNVVTMFLIFRQGFTSPDMYLALILATCDICLVTSKLGLYIFYAYAGSFDLFSGVLFGQLYGLYMCLLISTSVLCVGYLALLRCWVIFLNREINVKLWLSFFLIQQGILVVALVVTAFSHEFKLAPVGHFFSPDPVSSNLVTRLDLFFISSWILFSVVAVNVAYPAICLVYLRQIDSARICLDWRPRILAHHYVRRKLSIVVRICSLMLIYDLVMIPALLIVTKEFLLHRPRSLEEDSFLSLSMLSLAIVNPLTLIFLHRDIFSDVKSICTRLFHTKPYICR
ncbi:hypothetical protein DSO57_1027830 [Entomophthora muscae]|uniref:Uncharacterized protein n=1 Tax=Entomophthora muscae TaxID=34485 RepID=A0ACC2RGG1_9FUNG|nr:hypothetical protein DSO57_1027830 [Entomophthora muscae]